MPVRHGSGEKFLLITEEIEICKRLSSNDVAVRRKGLKALKNLFKNIHGKKEVDVDDFKRLWNGIFNYVWMSDKPLVQEEDVESISKLIHIIKTWELTMLYVKGFFSTLAYQWNRMSHHRTDKFLMFVRRFIRHVLFALKYSEWNSHNAELFSDELYSAIQDLPIGLVTHLSDIYIEEVAKVSDGNIPTPALILLLKCYFDCIVNLKPSMNAVNHFNSNIFSGLVRQLKLYIKQKALVAADSSEHSNDEPPNEFCDNGELDPRPGRVDVYLPYIELDENMIVEYIEKLQTEHNLSVKAKNILKQLASMFRSITKLRQSVQNPKIILREADEPKRKRKRKNRQTMAKLIKKSCQQLELEDVEYDSDSDKILKKLQQMSDIIQIPVGKSMFTVQKKSSSETKVSRKRKREVSATVGTWIVTDNSTDHTDNLTDPEIINVDTNNKDSERETSTTDHEIVNVDTNDKDNEPDTSAMHHEIVNMDTKNKDSEPDTSATDHEIVNVDTKNEDSEPDTSDMPEMKKTEDAECYIEETKKLKLSEEGENHVSFNSEIKINEFDANKENDELTSTAADIVVPLRVIKDHPTLLKPRRSYVAVDFHSKNDTIDTTSLPSSEKETANNNDITITKEKSPETLTSDHPAWTTVPQDELENQVLKMEEEEEEEIDYDISSLFRSPKRRRRSVMTPGMEVKRSARLANKAKLLQSKKVEFAGKKFQDVRDYHKSVQSRPAIPFDASKKPFKGILKAFSVPSPINPFFYPNGKRKVGKRN